MNFNVLLLVILGLLQVKSQLINRFYIANAAELRNFILNIYKCGKSLNPIETVMLNDQADPNSLVISSEFVQDFKLCLCNLIY
jgi:hypothetical protein